MLKKMSQLDFESVINSVFNGIIIMDEKGIIQYVNKASKDILHFKTTHPIGRHYFDFFQEEGLFPVLQHLKKAPDEREMISKYKLKLSDKVVIVSSVSLVKEGAAQGVIVMLQDISQFEFIAEELKAVRELNKEMDAIINNSYDGIWVMDGEGRTIRINETYEEFSGIKSSEVVGRNIKDLLEEGYFTDSAGVHVIEEKKPKTVIHDIKNGKRAMVTAAPIFNEEGEIWRIVANVRDITELIELKEQIEDYKAESQNYKQKWEQLKDENKEVISSSKEMQNVMEYSKRVAQVESTVLLLGESGVGKDVMARMIHESSDRKENAFVKVNCGALPENILEAELFGYEKGTFTGGLNEGKQGLVETANGGTLFLDEIAELPLHLQPKLLQVIQDRSFYRVGGRKNVKVNVRIIAATNQNLKKMVEDGKFRGDLYYRLNIIPIHLPPLRDRKEDIPLLVNRFLTKCNEKYGYEKSIIPEVMDILISYDWPGNVRELENIIERLVVTTASNTIDVQDLPRPLKNEEEPVTKSNDNQLFSVSANQTYKEAIDTFEKKLITHTLREHGSIRKAAHQLNIHHSTLARKAQKLNIKIKP